MKCPTCHSDNPDTTRFCGECGSPLRKDENIHVSVTKTLQTPVQGFTRGSSIAGRYKILEELGRGGMGVVYKAEDTKLKRAVALKFLSPELTRDTEAKERFILEAQAASALDHANICTVHEIDQTNGQMYIAMSYIDGQSVRERIQAGPLKLDVALDMAIQITKGLNEAHEKGIVHRDIKSANIMVDAKGQANIMDFGVAKLTGRTKFTQTGTTMGTIAYMSPEQAQGEKVDYRSDLWSLGVVLYEMVTGQLPFKGNYEQAVVYSILNEQPEPITGLRVGVPMELERIVNKTLAKKSSQRYQHADDLLVDLQNLKDNLPDLVSSSQISRATMTAVRPRKIQKSLLWKVTGTVIVVATIAVLVNVWQTRQPAQIPVSRFAVNLPPGEFLAGPGPSVAISHDGKNVAYVAKRGDVAKLYLRPIDKFESKPIQGTEGATAPFFSPDGKWVGFFADGKLKKASLLGGAPQDICDTETGFELFGAYWGRDDKIIFADPVSMGLRSVPAIGGEPQRIVSPLLDDETGKYEGNFNLPQTLPGGKAILFSTTDKVVERQKVGVYSLESGENKFLLDGSHARYIQTGHLVYARAGDLLAVPFDVKKLEVTGTPIPVIEGVQRSQQGMAHFSVSEDGDLVYVPGRKVVPEYSMVWADRTGEILPIGDLLPGSHGPRLSPDGSRVVFKRGKSLWLYELERKSLLKFTDDEADEWWPLWTPDGKQVVFNSNRLGASFDLHLRPAEGGPAEPLFMNEYGHQPQTWSADGKELIFTQGPDPDTGVDIWVLPFEGDRKPRPLIKTRYNEFHPTISPDGRWLAYASDETGTWEVYVRSYPGLDKITRISADGGCEPVWAPGGKEIFYRDSTGNKIMAASIETEPELRVGKPEFLFEGDYFLCLYWGRSYDLTNDGERFLLITESEQQLELKQYRVVLNWFEELKQIVPSE